MVVVETDCQFIESEDEILEMPSCIELLVSSAEQLRQFAREISGYYIKLLLTYGYVSEPPPIRLHQEQQKLDHSASKTGNQATEQVDKGGREVTSNGWFATRSTKTRIDKEANKHPPEFGLNELSKDQRRLECLNSVLEVLPHLNELSSFMERCFATIESTLKRATYYLNKISVKKPTSNMVDEEFQLTSEVKIHPIFFALMDLFYAIVSLDKVIQNHTSIGQNLNLFKSACQLVVDLPPENSAPIYDSDTCELPKDRLKDLVNLIATIELSLFNENRTIFQQCLEHLQHLDLILSNDKSNKGYTNLCQHFEEFILFYGENLTNEADEFGLGVNSAATKLSPHQLSLYMLNLNIIPTLFMTSNDRKVFGLSSIFILYTWIFKRRDKKTVKSINQTLVRNKNMNLIHLVGSNSYLFLNEILTKHLHNSLLDNKTLKQLSCIKESLLKLNTAEEFDRLTMKAVPWLVKLKAEALKGTLPEVDEPRLNILCRQMALFKSGLRIVVEINHCIRNIMTIYLHLNRPMTKNSLIPLFRLITLLKSIEASLRQSRLLVYNCTIKIEQIVRVRWRKLMLLARKRLVSLKYADRKLDTSSTLVLSSICANQIDQLTDFSRSTLALSLSMFVSSLEMDEVNSMNKFLGLLGFNVYEQLDLNANCAYLYWNIPTFTTYYSHIFEHNPSAINEVKYFHLALDDIQGLFMFDQHQPTWDYIDDGWLRDKRDEFLRRLGEELVEQLKTDLFDKICQELEIELRLQTHRDLNLDVHNPFKRHLYNFKHIFAQSPSTLSRNTFTIFRQFVPLANYVEQHLNKICYNLTSIAPHDWYIYDSMKNLAKLKYNLEFVNSQLPTQTLDYSLDLLDITRNLAVFVSRYSYDLTNQLFIEKSQNRLSSSSAASFYSGSMSMISAHLGHQHGSTSNPALNVVQIRHISKSLQTHGYGLLNSAVNCTYQVMKRLVSLISRQLADDKLRAVLAKEQQQLNNSIQTGKQKSTMSFDKANRMAKKFRLSASEVQEHSGQQGADLDSLRQSITQLGNLLAFIRMLKSGALNCASKSVDNLPDLNDLSILRLSSLVKSELQAYQCDSLCKAVENFDQCLADLDENFSPKTNYFSILVDLFSKILLTSAHNADSNATKEASQDKVTERSTANAGTEKTKDDQSEINKTHQQANKRDHLKLFYLIVPAITINYIDYIINCKERVSSRLSAARFGALISDDGFSMGIAFLLTVLRQTQHFAKLEWFELTRSKLNEDRKEVECRISDSRQEESLRQTSSMTLRRLNRLVSEYGSLEYTLSSALLFFRTR